MATAKQRIKNDFQQDCSWTPEQISKSTEALIQFCANRGYVSGGRLVSSSLLLKL